MTRQEVTAQARQPLGQQNLAGQTVLLSGGSRGIGLAIALRAARDGANVALIAKTNEPDPRLPGTIHSAAESIEAAGGQALPILGDVRDPDLVAEAVESTVGHFGRLDIVVNNASAIDLHGFGDLTARRFSLLVDVNIKGTFQLVTSALPYLRQAPRGQVLTLSPPLNLDVRWLQAHAPYTLTKYGMTLLTLGLAAQESSVSAFCLWPQTLIATAAVQNVVAGDAGMRAARRPEMVADAAHLLLMDAAGKTSGRCFVDADVLAAAGQHVLSGYAAVPGTSDVDLERDLFV